MRKITYKLLLMSFLSLLIFNSYAQKTLYTPPVTKTFNFTSIPEGARVYYQGNLICPSTPGSATITCKGVIRLGKKKEIEAALQKAAHDSRLTFTFVKDGYISQDVHIEPNVTPQKKVFLFDWTTTVSCYMQKNSTQTSDKDTSIPRNAASEIVNRDNPGQTNLERTIIRWYFESEPQGARIFWRVISSCPDQVKNTNELWLGTTPFEETRSFNIQGLTYENARDVQIEIKVRRNGYLDQTKRFNVRQAIDQQEISSFFEMVKANE